MYGNNCTAVTEFIILGLTDDPTFCVILFVIFLGVYAVTLVGNYSIIILIRNNSQLHTPMYLFLSYLLFVDIAYSSSVTLIMLKDFLVDKIIIPLEGCVDRMCCGATFGTAECFLLAAMAYNQYVAICSPLLYSTNMSPKICALLLITPCLSGCVNSWIAATCLLNWSFYRFNKINHFFCDYSPLLKLSYSEDNLAEILLAASTRLVIEIRVVIFLICCVYILFSVLKISSTEGRFSAFSTRTSHLTAVTLFYATTIFIYIVPNSSYIMDENKVMSIFCVVIIPMLNP